jgi:hypothetical protein
MFYDTPNFSIIEMEISVEMVDAAYNNNLIPTHYPGVLKICRSGRNYIEFHCDDEQIKTVYYSSTNVSNISSNSEIVWEAYANKKELDYKVNKSNLHYLPVGGGSSNTSFTYTKSALLVAFRNNKSAIFSFDAWGQTIPIINNNISMDFEVTGADGSSEKEILVKITNKESFMLCCICVRMDY